MYITLKRDLEVCDGSKPVGKNQTTVPIGRHEVERVPNPYGLDCFWLVLKGTKIGGSEGFWRQFADPESAEYQVIVED